MAKPSERPNASHRTKRIDAWRKARALNYSETYNKETLARMLVELEDTGKHIPEFELDEAWPDRVAHLKAD